MAKHGTKRAVTETEKAALRYSSKLRMNPSRKARSDLYFARLEHAKAILGFFAAAPERIGEVKSHHRTLAGVVALTSAFRLPHHFYRD
jgi:hypothetical protein